MFICLPFSLISALIFVLFQQTRQNNALTLAKGEKLSGIHKGAIGAPMNINEIKTVAKSKGSSINDFIMSTLSVSLYNYFKSKGKTEEQITLTLPASFKKKAKTADSLILTNELCPIFFHLNLTDDFH